ncbi:MAG: Rieske 2Fe-2S domain-containing protein [Desulfobacterales bacterium]|jgi:Rieske Fe-S protein|nr:Rieske 2Fe-2S domain-containing protein [Desulfobacterales bacterium]
MPVKSLKRNFFQRVCGIPATSKPQSPDCWQFSAGKLTIDLKKAPELHHPGGAIRLEGGNLPERILVVHGEDGVFRMFQNRCTHIGHRRLDPVPGTNTVQCCSVNKSTYDVKGTKIHGPTSRPILAYPVSREGDKLIGTIS